MKKMLSRILIFANAFFMGNIFNNQFPVAMNCNSKEINAKHLNENIDYIYDIIKKNVDKHYVGNMTFENYLNMAIDSETKIRNTKLDSSYSPELRALIFAMGYADNNLRTCLSISDWIYFLLKNPKNNMNVKILEGFVGSMKDLHHVVRINNCIADGHLCQQAIALTKHYSLVKQGVIPPRDNYQMQRLTLANGDPEICACCELAQAYGFPKEFIINYIFNKKLGAKAFLQIPVEILKDCNRYIKENEVKEIEYKPVQFILSY